MSKVSVVIPIYNSGKKLHKCIKSILNQTFKDFELILVNDGSTDNSLDICKHYSKKDNRIVLINKKNEGSITTRRRGVEAANSKFVMFVDADDWVDKKIIEILYADAIKYDLDITVCNTYRVLNNFTLLKKKNQSSYFIEDKIYQNEEIKNGLATAYLHGHPFPASLFAKLYKKELLLNCGNYLKQIKFLGDDLFYNLEMFLKSNKVKVSNQSLYFYRAGGFTSRYMSFLFDDMVNGYEIQKEVINNYYQDSREKQFVGISLMLLNTFKTCLENLFKSKLTESEMKKRIFEYSSNNNVIECLSNEGSKRYFPNDYLLAIHNKDVDYLYSLGRNMYKKSLPKKYLISIISKIQ